MGVCVKAAQSSGYTTFLSSIKSLCLLAAKYVTKPVWEKLEGVVTKTSGFTLAKAIAPSVHFDNQHCGIYAGDWDTYKDFAEVFDPLIQEYHSISMQKGGDVKQVFERLARGIKA